MILSIFIGLLLIVSFLIGILGALTGLGGGVILIPFLVIILKVNIYYAMGSSLICVIATSSGSAIANLNENHVNIKIGIFLAVMAVLGALIGASLILTLNSNIIAIIFGMVLLISAYLSMRPKKENKIHAVSHPWALSLGLEQSWPNTKGYYLVQNVPLAWGIMFIAGILSSLLGIGSGALNVLAMDQTMKLPYRVAASTSNFIIGIIATVSAGIYFTRGYIDPILTFPIVIGVLAGSFFGGKILHKANIRYLRIMFSVLIIFLGAQMIFKGLGGY